MVGGDVGVQSGADLRLFSLTEAGSEISGIMKSVSRQTSVLSILTFVLTCIVPFRRHNHMLYCQYPTTLVAKTEHRDQLIPTNYKTMSKAPNELREVEYVCPQGKQLQLKWEI